MPNAAISSYQDSPEKRVVRVECWGPLLSQRKQQKGSRIKYLTMPGKHLSEIEILVRDNTIEGMSDLILCELRLFEYYQICRDLPRLPYNKPAEVPIVAQGRIESLLTNGSLDRHLPIDAANLDFEGGAWGNDRSQTSTKLSAIKHLIEKQGAAKSAFTLFVTVSTKGGGESVLEDVLAEYQDLFGEDTWRQISSLPHHGKILIAFPIILTHWATDFELELNCSHRYTYIGDGLSTRMLKFAFELQPFQVPNFTSITKHKGMIERQSIRSILEQGTIELSYNKETDVVDQIPYQP